MLRTSSTAAPERAIQQRAAVGLLLALFLASSFAAAAQAQGLKFWKRKDQPVEGTQIAVQGTVTDASGRPVPGVEVVLQGARRAFSYREFRRADFNPREVSDTTGADGSFEIDWTWHRYYNHFRLTAVFEVPRGGDVVDPVQLAQIDLTERMRSSSPVVVQLVTDDSEGVAELARVRAFEAKLGTDDERRVYREQGMPDQVDRVPGAGEQTWWYFDRGAAYRFTDGNYVELDRFDPVEEADEVAG